MIPVNNTINAPAGPRPRPAKCRYYRLLPVLLITACTPPPEDCSALRERVRSGDKVAFASIETLAKSGHASAQRELGFVYHWGSGREIGIPHDNEKALYWFRLAAEQNDHMAQSALGSMYLSGNGVPADEMVGFAWYLRSAEGGNNIAQLVVAGCYAIGRGTHKDSVLAYKWANIAAARGVKSAEDWRNRLEKEMTRDEIAEAQKLSREWNRSHD